MDFLQVLLDSEITETDVNLTADAENKRDEILTKDATTEKDPTSGPEKASWKMKKGI